MANALIADGEGDDWTGAVLRVDLSAGSVYHDDSGQGGIPSPWPFFPPEREFDTNVGIFDDGTAGIAGGAGDLGGGALSLNAPQISVTWFNTDADDLDPVQIAMITLSPDATGTWELITSFTGGQLLSSGVVINGTIVPEPASLTMLVLGSLAMIRQR